MSITSLKLLLGQVNQLRDQYRKISFLTGENFNVFKILNVDTSEVRLHSSFIAELLNTKGLHAQHDIYLQLFIDHLGLREREFNTVSALVEVEKYVGPINTEYTEGGRIDIAITDGDGRQIFIENKIYAKDQKNQLLRYYNANNNAMLFYLTLHGDEPTSYSSGDDIPSGNVRCISYASDILRWLESCRKESVNIPVVRETLTQYIHLINFLTNQSEASAMSSEIRQFLMSNPELIDSIEECFRELQAMLKEMNDDFIKMMNKKFRSIPEELKNGYAIKAVWGEDGDGVHFGYQAWLDGKNVSNSSVMEVYRERLKEINGEFHTGSGWLGWLNPEPFKRYQRFRNLSAKQIVELYENKDSLRNMVDAIVKQEVEIRTMLLSSTHADALKI